MPVGTVPPQSGRHKPQADNGGMIEKVQYANCPNVVESAAPPWKCEHGVYTAGDPTGRSPYCSFCTPEGPREDDELEPRAFQTCGTCWKTLAIEEFPLDPRTGTPARNCLACAPPKRVQDPTLPVAERKKEYGLRRRARHGDGDFTMAAWIEKVAGAGWCCTFCECSLTSETLICARWIPRSHGGRNDISSCMPACKRCAGIFTASRRGHSQRLAA